MDDQSVKSFRCEPDPDGWRCAVTIGDDSRATRHEVVVRAEHLARIAPPGVSVEGVVAASFDFLLAREPRESILSSFDLADISRYFPEFEVEIRKRVYA